MKIALDIRGVSDHPAGKGIWTKSVLETLLSRHPDHQYFLLSDGRETTDYLKHPHVHLLQVEGGGLSWHWKAYQRLLEVGVKVFLASESYIIPYLHDPKKLKVALVVHDLVVFRSPSKHQKKAQFIERFTLKKAAKKAKWIFTVSGHTKKDLLEQYPGLPLDSKTSVVYAGIREAFLKKLSAEILSSTQHKFNLLPSYLLMASTLEPRKNIVGVLEAYSGLSDELKSRFPLVIAGKKGWYYEEIFQKVKTLKLAQSVLFLGYVSDEDLLALLQGATAFLFPSFYEGFGLPVVEAMANSVPVLTSNNSSLPEVGGEAVCYVNPNDSQDIKRGMEKLLEDENYRQELIEKGRKQAQLFSWGETVELILEKIREGELI